MKERIDHAAEAMRLIDQCLAEEDALLEALRQRVNEYGDMTWEEADRAILDFKKHRGEETSDVEQTNNQD